MGIVFNICKLLRLRFVSHQGRSLSLPAGREGGMKRSVMTEKVQPVCSRATAIDLQTAVPFGCDLGNLKLIYNYDHI